MPAAPISGPRAIISQDSLTAIDKDWHVFADAVRARLEVGAREYGDASLKRAPQDLLEEIQQELIDVVGWGFLLWLRLRSLEEKIAGSSK